MNWNHVRKTETRDEAERLSGLPGGLAGWLLDRLRQVRLSGVSLGGVRLGLRKPAPRLALLERITLAPRQTLALVEAEGRRFLVASSAEGAPAFYPIDGGCGARTRSAGASARASSAARVSW